MADLENKKYLDSEGLALYDSLIKQYISEHGAEGEIEEIFEAVEELSTAVSANSDAIEVLNGEGEGSVKKTVKDALAELVDGAPEAFDTLKEIADWIAQDETGTQALINRVASLENANTELKTYVDAQDKNYYSSINSIESVKIAGLFPVSQSADESAKNAIDNLEEGKGVKLTANQDIADNITIDKDCYIDANGSTFSGVITIPADKNVVIENATFSNPVVVE